MSLRVKPVLHCIHLTKIALFGLTDFKTVQRLHYSSKEGATRNRREGLQGMSPTGAQFLCCLQSGPDLVLMGRRPVVWANQHMTGNVSQGFQDTCLLPRAVSSTLVHTSRIYWSFSSSPSSIRSKSCASSVRRLTTLAESSISSFFACDFAPERTFGDNERYHILRGESS